MIIKEGQGVGGHVRDESPLTLCFDLFFTMVSNGVDTTRFPCSAVNVKVVQNERGRTTGVSMTLLYAVCCVLLSCLSHVLHVHIQMYMSASLFLLIF